MFPDNHKKKLSRLIFHILRLSYMKDDLVKHAFIEDKMKPKLYENLQRIQKNAFVHITISNLSIFVISNLIFKHFKVCKLTENT